MYSSDSEVFNLRTDNDPKVGLDYFQSGSQKKKYCSWLIVETEEEDMLLASTERVSESKNNANHWSVSFPRQRGDGRARSGRSLLHFILPFTVRVVG